MYSNIFLSNFVNRTSTSLFVCFFVVAVVEVVGGSVVVVVGSGVVDDVVVGGVVGVVVGGGGDDDDDNDDDDDDDDDDDSRASFVVFCLLNVEKYSPITLQDPVSRFSLSTSQMFHLVKKIST